MSIRRGPSPEDNFTIVRNELMNDPRLSWETLGLLNYLLSKPENWVVHTSQLAKFRSAGRDKIRSMLNEAIAAGYVERTRARGKDGAVRGWDYVVFGLVDTVPGFTGGGESATTVPVFAVHGESGHVVRTDSDKELSTTSAGAEEEDIWNFEETDEPTEAETPIIESKATWKPDPIYDALAAVLGSKAVTKTQHSQWSRVVSELKAANATPDEICAFAAQVEEHIPRGDADDRHLPEALGHAHARGHRACLCGVRRRHRASDQGGALRTELPNPGMPGSVMRHQSGSGGGSRVERLRRPGDGLPGAHVRQVPQASGHLALCRRQRWHLQAPRHGPR